jgi:glycerophosphoryl diester phosphodiesterase
MPFKGYTQQQYALDMLAAFRNKGIDPSRVWAQSFLYDDILFWLKNAHDFGKQAIFLQEYDTPADLAAGLQNLTQVKAAGVNIVGPAIPMLISIGGPDNKTIVPSAYANAIKAAGLDIIAWTYERSGPLATVKSRDEYYFSSVADVVSYDGQYFEILDVLANQIGIRLCLVIGAQRIAPSIFSMGCVKGALGSRLMYQQIKCWPAWMAMRKASSSVKSPYPATNP